MSSIKIKLVELVSEMNYLNIVLMSFIDLKGVHPIKSSEIVGSVKGLTSLSNDNPCTSILDIIDDMEKAYSFELGSVACKVADGDFREMFHDLQMLNEKLSDLAFKINDLKQNIEKYKDALVQVQYIENLDVPLDDLFACEYLFFRFGRIPNDSLEKLKSFMNRPFVLNTFKHDKDKTWCMYYTTSEYKKEVDNIFSSMLFERIMIPDFIHGTPKDAKEALENEHTYTRKMIDNYQIELQQNIDENRDHLSEMKCELLFLHRIYEAKKYALGMGNKFNIMSFVKVDQIEEFKKTFETMSHVEIEIKDPLSDGRVLPPKHIKEKWFYI